MGGFGGEATAKKGRGAKGLTGAGSRCSLTPMVETDPQARNVQYPELSRVLFSQEKKVEEVSDSGWGHN